jgi:cell division protein FtsZ
MEDRKKYENEILNMLFDGCLDPHCKILTIGGAGRNTGEHIFSKKLKNTTVIHINTHMAGMDELQYKGVLLGHTITTGQGACYPEVAQKCLELSIDKIKENVISKNDIVIVIAGMGGGTGTGAAPMVAEIAKQYAGMVVGIVFTPFSSEGRNDIADAILKMEQHTRTTIVLENDRLLEIAPEATLKEAFDIMNRMVMSIIKRVSCEYRDAVVHKVIENVPTIIETMKMRDIAQMPRLAMSARPELAHAISAEMPPPRPESPHNPPGVPGDIPCELS